MWIHLGTQQQVGTLTTTRNTTLKGITTQTVSGGTKFSVTTTGNVSAAGTFSATEKTTLSGATTVQNLLTITVPNAGVSGVSLLHQCSKFLYSVSS